jgi:cold shock CspA family protein
MGQQRYTGTLKKWNAERGFGFITADDGGQDIFVHISAFARSGSQPQVGAALSFAVEPDRNGKRSAVQVRRTGEPVRELAPQRPVRLSKSAKDTTPGFFAQMLGVVLICALAFFGYSQYSKQAASYDSILPSLPASIAPAKLSAPADFKCDGRNMCSQMTSCREATLFLQNCPGMKLDGNGDGVPCEQQWCTN